MARVSYSQRLDLAAVQALLTSPQGGVTRDLLRRGLQVETQAKRNLGGIGGPKRVDTGRLRASITTQVVLRDGAPAVVVGTNVVYARWIHDGTGIYGPKGQRIQPKRAKRLRWPDPRRPGRYIFARSVAGIRPNPFLKNALSAART